MPAKPRRRKYEQPGFRLARKPMTKAKLTRLKKDFLTMFPSLKKHKKFISRYVDILQAEIESRTEGEMHRAMASLLLDISAHVKSKKERTLAAEMAHSYTGKMMGVFQRSTYSERRQKPHRIQR